MKYIALRDFEDVASALKFDTGEIHVTGLCDLYTTKAAGRDKKLYKSIETTLQDQYEAAVKVSEQLSTSQAQSLAASLNLARDSPFGSFTNHSARRTFAYLIATLNASHPDYDFSHVLRPSDFRQLRVKSAITELDSTIYSLRPRGAAVVAASAGGPLSDSLMSIRALEDHSFAKRSLRSQSPLMSKKPGVSGIRTPGGQLMWGPRMWDIIDEEMTLAECVAFEFAPEEDPFDDEEGALWSFNYFLYNKERKRVCYLHLRAQSIMSQSPSSTVQSPTTPMDGRSVRSMYFDESPASGGPTTPITIRNGKRRSYGTALGADDSEEPQTGANKRAAYWLGGHASVADVTDAGGEHEDDEDNDRYDEDE